MTAAKRKQAPPEPAVRRMFDEIVPRYDLVNDVLSAGMNRAWRRQTLQALHMEAGPVLDLGCGTGRLAEQAAAAPRTGRDRSHHSGGADNRSVLKPPRLERSAPHRVVGLDVSGEMLREAARRLRGRVALVQGSAFRLPFEDAVFGGAVSGFVLRNLEDLPGAFLELVRVLAPGAGLALVDITEPREPLRRRLFDAYFRVAAPFVGGLAGRKEAYRYLVKSLAQLPPAKEVASLLAWAGCEQVRWRVLKPGMVTLWTARRAPG